MLDEAHGQWADQDLAWCSYLSSGSCPVDGSAHDRVDVLHLTCQWTGDHFASVYSDSREQADVVLRRQFGIEMRDRHFHVERRPDGTLGIIFVHDWRPEECHHDVPTPRADRAAVPLDQTSDRVEKRRQDEVLGFGVEELAEGRRIGQVSEEDGGQASIADELGGDRCA